MMTSCFPLTGNSRSEWEYFSLLVDRRNRVRKTLRKSCRRRRLLELKLSNITTKSARMLSSRIAAMSPNNRRLLLILLAASEQEEEPVERRWWVRPIFQRRMAEGAMFNKMEFMRERDPESFRNFFRMSPDQFDYILHLIHNDIAPSENSFREPIAAKHRLAVVIRYLAAGDSMTSLSYSCGISTCSIAKFVKLVCEALWLRLMPIVLPVPDTEKWSDVAEDMDQKWQLPNCVGAIDGKHIVMQAPDNAGSLYYNYKGTHSIVLLAICDARYRFLLVDIGGSGRNSDGGLFAASTFGRAMNSGQLGLPPPSTIRGIPVPMPYFFVGDAAFPLKDNLMRPYPGQHLDYEKRVCNYRFSRVRRLIENAFGIMSGRFRIFRGAIHANVNTVVSIVKAVVCLHNFLLAADQELPDKKKRYCPPRYNDTEDEEDNHNIINGGWRQTRNGFLNLRHSGFNHSLSSAQYRDWLKYFTNNHGTVPWQRRMVTSSS